MQTLRPVSNSPVHAVGGSSLASHKSLKVLLLNAGTALGLASTQKKQSLTAEKMPKMIVSSTVLRVASLASLRVLKRVEGALEAKDSVVSMDLHVLIYIFMDGYVFYCFYIAFTYEHLQRLTELLRLILISELNMIK